MVEELENKEQITNKPTGEFDINNELFANRGVIGRREFIINFALLNLYCSFFFMPFIIWVIGNANYHDYLNLNKLYFAAPFSIQLLYLFAAAFMLVVGISNIKRRLNDIFGKINMPARIVTFSIFVLCVCSIFLPFLFGAVLGILNVILILFLFFKKGQITSKLPHNPLKAFNFGAFFGTWIWGLFNKSYKTLWMLLLGLTPYGFYYALYCGFKGNRWAYEATKAEDEVQFIEKQKTQGIIFTALYLVFSFLFAPVILFMGTLGATMTIFSSNTQKTKERIEQLDEFINELATSYFVSYTIADDKNEFYVEEVFWETRGLEEKMKLFQLAANIASQEKNSRIGKDKFSGRTYKYKEMNKTKIYGSKTRQLIAEYYFDNSNFDKGFAHSYKEMMKAYKFHEIKK